MSARPTSALVRAITLAGERHRHSVAAVDDHHSLSFAELLNLASEWANTLDQVGTSRTLTAISIPKSAETVAAMLACLISARPYVVVDHEEELSPDFGVESVVRSSKQRLIVDRVDGTRGPKHDSTRLAGPLDDSIAYVISTSGTSGQSKRPIITHANLWHYIAAIKRYLHIPAGWRFLHSTSLGTDLGHTSLFPALATGGTVHLLPREALTEVDFICSYVCAAGLDVVKLTPSVVRAIVSNAPNPELLLPREALVVGGEEFSGSLARDLLGMSPACRIVNHYGPSETTVGVLAHDVNASDVSRRSVPIGTPLGRNRARLDWSPGNSDAAELVIHGPSVGLGYWQRPDLTDKAFTFRSSGNASYRTGDWCNVSDDGEFVFAGRQDRQVKVRGHRVDLQEVERVLRGHPHVQQVSVDQLSERGGALRATVIADPATDEEDLRSFAASKLRGPEVPAVIEFRSRVAITASGKFDQRAHSQLDGGAGRIAATSDEAVKVAADLLGIEPSAVVDGRTFVQLGGHSLEAVALAASLRRIGRDVSPSALLGDEPLGEMLSRALETTRLPQIYVADEPVRAVGIQRYFLDTVGAVEGPWNQGVVCDVPPGLDSRSLSEALLIAARRHDMLSCRFERRGREWLQIQTASLRSSHLIRSVVPDGSEQAVLQAFNRAYALTSASRGPALVGALVIRPTCDFDAVAISAHHLYVDALSWPLLLADLANALEAIQDGAPRDVERRVHPGSFLRWAAAQGAVASRSYKPRRHSGIGPASSETSQPRALSFECDVAEFLTDHASDTDALHFIERSLALGSAHAAQRGSAELGSRCYIALEGHGRDASDPDASSAVGWFTEIRVVAISARENSVREVDSSNLDRVQIGVNFFGRIAEVASAHLPRGWTFSALPPGELRNSGAALLFPIVVSASLRGSTLRVHVLSKVEPQEMRRFANALQKQIASQLRATRTVAPRKSARWLGAAPFNWLRPHDNHHAAESSRRDVLSDERVLLTGATGYVGVHLLHELLYRTRAPVQCLVRANSCEEGLRRILASYGRFFPSECPKDLRPRIVPILGDITSPALRVMQPDLVDSTLIFHAAADVRLAADPARLWSTNVDGTARLLDFADRHLRDPRIVFLSTTRPSASEMPYHRSKFAAESLVRAFDGTGSRHLVIRTGLVAPAWSDGAFQENIDANKLFLAAKAYVTDRVAPFCGRAAIGLTYVDRLAANCVELGLAHSSSDPATLRIDNPNVVSQLRIVESLQAMGYTIRLIELDQYVARADLDEHGYGAALCEDDQGEELTPFDTPVSFLPPDRRWFESVWRRCQHAGFLPATE